MFIEKEKLISILEEAFQKGYESFLECKNEYVQQVIDCLEEQSINKNYQHPNTLSISNDFNEFQNYNYNYSDYPNAVVTTSGIEATPARWDSNYYFQTHNLTYNHSGFSNNEINNNIQILDFGYYNNLSSQS